MESRGFHSGVEEGKMFFLFPGVWHTYRPFENSGWKEYWIGFKGEMIDRLVASGYFSACSPVFDIGLNERIIDLYLKARDIANEDRWRTTGPFGDRDAPARTDVLPPEKQCPAR